MRKIFATLAALVLLLLFAGADAQAIDLEVGHELSTSGPAVYLLARDNLPTGKVLGTDTWLLPELGAFYRYREPALDGYARLQFLLEVPAGTLAIDGRVNLDGSARVRTALRFGIR